MSNPGLPLPAFEEQLVFDLAEHLGSTLPVCRRQIMALIVAGYSWDAIRRAVNNTAEPGMAPWEWTARVTGRHSTNGAKGLTTRDILAMKEQK